MKRFLFALSMPLWIWSGGSAATPTSVAPSKEVVIRHEHALAWQRTFLALWKAKQYQSLKFMDRLGEREFSDHPLWKDPQFRATWQAWLRVRAQQGWSVGDGNVGMWRLAEGQNALRPSIGFKREGDGSWWVVFVQPQQVKNQHHAGWECRGRCKVTVSNGHRKRSLDMRPPQSEEWQRVYTLGAVIPYELLTSSANLWTVQFPNGDRFDFDVSFAPSICQQLLGACWSNPTASSLPSSPSTPSSQGTSVASPPPPSDASTPTIQPSPSLGD